MKRNLLRIFVAVLIAVIVASPALLLIDVQKYSPVVVTVWLLSIVYYVFSKRQK